MVLSRICPQAAACTTSGHFLPKLSVYLLSFVFVAIYWNNHHHLTPFVERVSGAALWAMRCSGSHNARGTPRAVGAVERDDEAKPTASNPAG